MFRASAFVLGVLGSALLRAEPVTFSFPASDPPLEAAQTVEVRITGVPDGVEEFEVLLVGGTGRPFDLRVTESLPGGTRSFLWTVPNLDLPEARLKIRMDQDDREVESEPSEPFRIESSSAGVPIHLESRWGEVWVDPGEDEDDAFAPVELPGSGLAPVSPSLERPSATIEGVVPPSPAGSTDPVALATVSSHPQPLPSPIGVGMPRSRVPRFVPPRI